jgi:hypothetical protein
MALSLPSSLLLPVGCTLTNGQPWVQLQLTISARPGYTQGVASATQAIDASLALALDGQPARVALDPSLCSDACQLASGDLSSMSLSVPAARPTLRAFGTRSPLRLPADGSPCDLTVPLDWRARTLVSGAVDKDSPVRIDLDATLLFTPRLFDGVGWIQPAEAITAASAANIKEHSSLDRNIEYREYRNPVSTPLQAASTQTRRGRDDEADNQGSGAYEHGVRGARAGRM